MDLSEIKRGAIVRSISSQQEMVVSEIEASRVLCVWYQDNKIMNELFNAEELYDKTKPLILKGVIINISEN